MNISFWNHFQNFALVRGTLDTDEHIFFESFPKLCFSQSLRGTLDWDEHFFLESFPKLCFNRRYLSKLSLFGVLEA